MAIVAFMAHLDMFIHMTFFGVSSKFSKRADQQRKQFKKYTDVKKLRQKQICHQKMAISLVFLPGFDLILRQLEGPLNQIRSG